MRLTMLTRAFFTVPLIALSWATSALATAAISITPSGASSYSVQGTSMDGVAGIELTIRYDTTVLSMPKVTQEGSLTSGALFVANPNYTPNTIKIAIISTKPFSGSGQIANLSFTTSGGAGSVALVSSSLIDSNGKPITGAIADSTPASFISSPGIPFSQTSAQQPTGSVTATTTSLSTYFGTVTMPSDQQQSAEKQPKQVFPVPADVEESVAEKSEELSTPSDKTVTIAKAEDTPQNIVFTGASERFKLYHGSKKLSDVAALFNSKDAQTVYQEPAIVLSDAVSKARLTVDLPSRTTLSPNFAVNGGKLGSFKQDNFVKDRWIFEVAPETGTSRTTVTIIVGADLFEYQVTVAPVLKTDLSFDERGWDTFLKETGTTTAPRHDLNGDGVRDYKDEFIFVANYLVRKSAPLNLIAPLKEPAKML